MKVNTNLDLKRTAALVNDFILSMLQGRPKPLYAAASHYIKSGGKRLRPFLVMKSCELLSGNLKAALAVAAAVEITHNFTLVHDDIMDNDESRHGVPTVHRQYGLPLAILAGDLLMMKSFQSIAKGIEYDLSHERATLIMNRLAESCIDISEGQVLDISFAASKKFPSRSAYIEMIKKKTAALFEVSCEVGALCANGKDDVRNLASYGRNLGIAFQLIDDLIGVAGDPKVTKKPVGNDIREGKKTLPMLLLIRRSDPLTRKKILRVFGKKDASNDEIKDIVNIIIRSGVEEEVRSTARLYATEAIKSINEYKESEPKQALISLANFVVERTL